MEEGDRLGRCSVDKDGAAPESGLRWGAESGAPRGADEREGRYESPFARASSLASSFRLCIASLNAAAKMRVGIAIRPIPAMAVSPAKIRPITVTGVTSPYPTVVSVATLHYNARGMLPKASGCVSPSRTYRKALEISMIRKATAPLSANSKRRP